MMEAADQPIIYADGNAARIGDRITFEHGASSGEVEDLIDSEAKRRKWGVTKNGIMIKAEEFGLVFYPESTILESKISLVSRQPVGVLGVISSRIKLGEIGYSDEA